MGKAICWGLLLWKHDPSGDENSFFTRGFHPKNHKHPLLLVIIEAHKKSKAMEKKIEMHTNTTMFQKETTNTPESKQCMILFHLTFRPS